MTFGPLDRHAPYRTGIQRFDDDHRHIVTLLYRLNRIATAEPGNPLAGDLLMRVAHDCDAHFQSEEQWMAEHRYPFPLAEAHRDDHDRLIGLLVGGQTPAAELPMHFLRQWLSGHVERFDTRLLAAATHLDAA